ncbi:hypothetical protein RJ639_024110 [Escallonia herrerae]|uniref:Uncharacterized protein n=1 Tax=Escallonia herrerae TaxID=1293975 RepID=A0AA89ADU7_9ASTE|nr:hypothetical protein RJ639_024110 [Escallonia herrerae]
MAAFQVMNQDFMKLDRFDGTNFTRWQDKMMFLLTALKVQYVLDPNLPPLSEITDNDSDETKAARKKREEDELVCRGHILNALSDHLYDLFTSSKCPKEIWKALENKYNNEKQGANKFLTLKYFEFTMNDSESVLDQAHQLQILVSKLKDLKVEAYRILDLESNVIVESRDVEFIEDKFNSDSDFSAPTISLEIDSNVGSSRENESVVPNNTTEPRRSQRARKEKILDPDFIDSQAIAFLVEGDRKNILKEIPIVTESFGREEAELVAVGAREEVAAISTNERFGGTGEGKEMQQIIGVWWHGGWWGMGMEREREREMERMR